MLRQIGNMAKGVAYGTGAAIGGLVAIIGTFTGAMLGGTLATVVSRDPGPSGSEGLFMAGMAIENLVAVAEFAGNVAQAHPTQHPMLTLIGTGVATICTATLATGLGFVTAIELGMRAQEAFEAVFALEGSPSSRLISNYGYAATVNEPEERVQGVAKLLNWLGRHSPTSSPEVYKIVP